MVRIINPLWSSWLSLKPQPLATVSTYLNAAAEEKLHGLEWLISAILV
jgi:hypothetical protein